jgi:hypothetical protein
LRVGERTLTDKGEVMSKRSVGKSLLFLCLIALLPSSTSAEEIKFDGYNWVELSSNAKVSMCLGVALGITEAHDWIRYKEVKGKAFENPADAERGLNEAGIVADRFLEEKGFDVFSTSTIGQIVETIDKLYSDPRIRLWKVLELMPIVQGRLKNGWTQQDVDEVIAYSIRVKEFWPKMSSGSITVDEYRKAIGNKPRVMR